MAGSSTAVGKRRVKEPGSGHSLAQPLFDAFLELVRGLPALQTDDPASGASTRRLDALRDAILVDLLRAAFVAFAEAKGLWRREPTPSHLHAALCEAEARGEPLEDRSTAWAALLGPFRPFGPEDATPNEAPSDRVTLRVLRRLLTRETEPIPYGDLQVEELGAAYERLVGLELRIATAKVALLAPNLVAIDLGALLEAPPGERSTVLQAKAGVVLHGRARKVLEGAQSIDEVTTALTRRAVHFELPILPGTFYFEQGSGRRRTGSHYTPLTLTGPLVAKTLGPLFERLGPDASTTRILDMKVCDASMGAGAFLVEACRFLAKRLEPALAREPYAEEDLPGLARRLVAEHCIFGVDQNPLAVELARLSVWLTAERPDTPLDLAHRHLVLGDALVGCPSNDPLAAVAIERAETSGSVVPVHFPERFPEVFDRERSGFDAFVGNPPWIAYAGRAAHPLEPWRRRYYVRNYASFHRYRTLHGLFIERCTSLLRPRGRLGLVVPTSVADLDGYEPTRNAHDKFAEVDPELPDFGNAFDGVFLPSMGLLSTRHEAGSSEKAGSRPFRVARTDLDPIGSTLLHRLVAMPALPSECFGERGFQTTKSDLGNFTPCTCPTPPFVVPIREGSDIAAFHTRPVRLHIDPMGLVGKLRSEQEFSEVEVLVRQTARFPIASKADGAAFRNSILACFGRGDLSANLLVAYLNASPIRWLHYMRYRDARQGMPQVKIAHLRAIPAPPPGPQRAELAELGDMLSQRNRGIGPDEQRKLDTIVSDMLGLSEEERALVASWAERHRAP